MRDKVLLFFPSYRSPEAAPPLALLALAPMVRERGYRVDIIDSTVEPNYKERILNQLDEAVCVGISLVTGPMIYEGVEVGRAVKAARPDVAVVLGGWHPSTLPDQTLKAGFVDAVVRSQGEITFAELVERLASGEPLSGLAGCSFKTAARIVNNPPRPYMDINQLPPKAYDMVDLEPYARMCGRRWLMYTSSHGCPYDCSYCSNASLYGRNWNALAAERVVREVTELVRQFRLGLVDIIDDNFLVDRKRGLEIARGFTSSGLRFEWYIQTTANFLLRSTDSEVQEMAASGLTRVFIGAESGSDEVLRSVNKVRFQGTRAIYDVAEKCHRAGIKSTFFLIFGLPDETEKDRLETLRMVHEIWKRFPTAEFYTNIYTPYPGAPNFRRAIDLGVQEPQTLEQWAEFFPKFQQLPWLRGARHRRIQRMRDYLRIGYQATPIKTPRTSAIKDAAMRALARPARARLAAGVYSFPLELWLLKSARLLRSAVM